MQASFRTLTVRLLILLAIVALAAGCNKIREINVTSFQVESFSPNGLRSVDAVVAIGVHNPTVAFTISDLKGTVRKGDGVLAVLDGGPVAVEKKSDRVYRVPCSVTLGESLSFFQVLSLLKNMDLDGCVVDVSALVSLSNGLKKTLEYKDIPVRDLLEKSRVLDNLTL